MKFALALLVLSMAFLTDGSVLGRSSGIDPKAEPGGLAAPDGPKVDRLATAVEILSRVPTGRELLSRAQGFWGYPRPELVRQALRLGAASRTDAVLTRRFDPATGQETRAREVTVYLRSEQSLEDLVLDLSHELVHATSRPGWDPYDPELTAGRYIEAAIDGEGGEVAAVASECQVSFEVMSRYGAAGASSQRCRQYLSRGKIDRERIRREFYRTGRWEAELRKKLGSEHKRLPLLNADSPTLFSSTGNAPYPMALYREFEEITRIACENSRKRATERSRKPAQVSAQSGSVRAASAAAFICARCSAFAEELCSSSAAPQKQKEEREVQPLTKR
jgi:hypothetical protein